MLFHHTLLKESLELDLKWNPLKWNWHLFKNSIWWSIGLLHKKGEKFVVWSFSRCKKNPYSANESYHFFLYIKHLKPVAVTYAFLYQILTSAFEELFIWETGRDKKLEGMIKQKRKLLSFLYRTVIGTCYCKWSRGI